MRSSDTRGRNGLSESGRRGSKGLKLRIAKQLPPLPTSAVQLSAQTSALYSPQLWQAAGQLQQRLSCDRDLYFPELAVSAPGVKQLPEDGAIDVQQGKRAKLAGGQYRRGSFREAAASDSTPPSTPYRPSRSAAAEERANSNAITSSSSSQDLSQLHQRRQSAVNVIDHDVAWPMVISNKRRRSSRLRRSNWQQWQLILSGLEVAAPESSGVCYQEPAVPDLAAGARLLAQQQQQLLAAAGQHVQQSACDHATGVADAQQQQDCTHLDVQQQDQAPPHGSVRATVLQMHPPAPKGQAVDQAACGKGLPGKPAAGDASPGHESQASEMTYMQDSPHAAAAQLNSWPSTSTESDCQGQQLECDVLHKHSLVVAVADSVGGMAAAAAVASRGCVHLSSPESPSSPFQGVA